mmetsp:Transcript_9698/g.15358  ORF Transcript_9698/g.15358 Transcript_9698/m.15358 type:complete len:102 (-) Transcript_9698:650-955(-)
MCLNTPRLLLRISDVDHVCGHGLVVKPFLCLNFDDSCTSAQEQLCIPSSFNVQRRVSRCFVRSRKESSEGNEGAFTNTKFRNASLWDVVLPLSFGLHGENL